MEGADKVKAANLASVSPALPAEVLPKQRAGGAEAVRGEKQADKQRVSREEIEQTVNEIGDFVQNIQRNLLFSVDDTSGETIIKVTDRETEDVIRQIPTEEVLQLQRYIKDASGILFKAKV